MQTEGTLAETSLAMLLTEMQSERATGTLTVTNQSESTSLYFLFGHLFHAAGQVMAGEDAVLDALTWQEGSFIFDPRAKLPAEETIKMSSDELVAEAQTRTPVAVGAPAEVAEVAAEPAYQPDSVVWPQQPTNGSSEPDYSATGPVEVTPSYDANSGYDPATGEAAQNYQFQSDPAAEEPVLPDEVEATQAYVETEAVTAPVTEPITEPVTTKPESKAPAKVEPEPEPEPTPALPTASTATASGRGNAAAALSTLPPLPSGKEIYRGLKTDFVDFQKLLNTLQKDRHTGYMQLDGANYTGYLLLIDGQPIEAVFASADKLTQGQEGLDKFREAMGSGEGMLDVLELPSGVISAMVQVLTSEPLFAGLVSRFIDFDELLGYLRDEKVTGALVVSAGSDAGVILLKGGDILGAYTKKKPAIENLTATVSNLASQNPKAIIEVRSGTPVSESAHEASSSKRG